MTGVDKCPVSRLINGVDTISIEDSGNARTPKYYKVLLSLCFFQCNYYCLLLLFTVSAMNVCNNLLIVMLVCLQL